MARRFLSETQSAGFRARVVGQHQVHDSWDQIQAFLKANLTPAHAAVFAEPYRGQGAMTWMTSADGEPQPLKDLDADAQSEARAKLDGLLADINRLADELDASGDPQRAQWATMLREIQEVPGGQEFNDLVYVADGNPTVTLWGMRDENSVALSALLKERIEKPQQVQPLTPPPGRDGTVTTGAVPVAAAGVPFWTWLLWLLFLVLLAIILWLLLRACAIGVPGAPSFFGLCDRPAALVAAQDERARLIDELERLRRATGQAPQCQVAQATPAPVPAPEPDTPDPAAPPLPDFDETDIDRAREEAQGQEGDVTITLLWNGLSDLDLLINCPSGRTITASSRSATCGGEVDIDANWCIDRRGGVSGGVCDNYRDEAVQNPVENAYFFTDGAQGGQYMVRVRHYAASQNAPGTSVPFVVQVSKNGDRQRYQGVAEPGDTIDVVPFTVLD